MNFNKHFKRSKNSIKFNPFYVFVCILIILMIITPFILISYKIEEKSTKQKFLMNYKEKVKTSDPGPSLSFYSFQIDDDNSGNSQGDNDGNIDAGETIELRLILENNGDEDAFNVNATLSSSNTNITITNGFQDFIMIPQGSTGMSSSFYIFKIDSSCSSDYFITINLNVEALNGGPWSDNFQIHVIGKGNPVYYTYSVYSEADGDLPADHDDIIDVGEIISLDIYVKNLGGANVYGITGIIAEDDPYVSIDDNSGDFGTINSNGDSDSGRFGITVSGSCPDKHQIDFKLNLTDNEGTKWERTFHLTVNGTTDYEIFTFGVIENSGDGDNYIDAGEEWYVNITIKNIGEANGHDVHVFPDTADSYASFYYSEYNRNANYGTVNVNETDTYSHSSYWEFFISDTAPANHEITISIRITDNSGYQQFFYEILTVVGKSDYEIFTFGVIENSGDGDNYIDAGEEWYVNITIKNIGEANGHDVHVFPDTADSYASFYYSEYNRNANYGTVNVNETDTYSHSSYWEFFISDTAPANHEITISIRITDNSGYNKNLEITIIVIEGGTPSNGNGGNGGDGLPPINWGLVGIVALIIVSATGGLVTSYYLVKRQKKQKHLRQEREIMIIKQKMKEKAIVEEVNKLITTGENELIKGNFSSALQKFNESFKIANENRKLISITLLNDIESKIKLTQDELNIEKENKIQISIKEGKKFESENKLEEALKSYKTALEYVNDLPKSKERGQLIKNLKSKIGNVYSIKIGELKDRAEELKNLGKPYNAIESYKMAIKEAENMYFASQRNKEIEDINYFINQTYLDMLKPNIDRAHQLRNEFKYEGAIKNYNEAMQIALNLTDKNLKSKKVRDIRRYINEVKVAIIKSTILDLGTKFGRLEVREIAEECGEDEELIVKTVKEMIEGNEIYARYFDSSRAVAFNLQANIDAIDNLMEKYKQWEKEEKDKI